MPKAAETLRTSAMSFMYTGAGIAVFLVFLQMGQAAVIRKPQGPCQGMVESPDGFLVDPTGCKTLNKRSYQPDEPDDDDNEEEIEKDYEAPYVWLRQTKYPVPSHKRIRYTKRTNDPYVWLKKRQDDKEVDPYVWLSKRSGDDDPYVWLNKRAGSGDDPYVWLSKKTGDDPYVWLSKRQDNSDPYVWLKKRGNESKENPTSGPFLFLRSSLTSY